MNTPQKAIVTAIKTMSSTIKRLIRYTFALARSLGKIKFALLAAAIIGFLSVSGVMVYALYSDNEHKSTISTASHPKKEKPTAKDDSGVLAAETKTEQPEAAEQPAPAAVSQQQPTKPTAGASTSQKNEQYATPLPPRNLPKEQPLVARTAKFQVHPPVCSFGLPQNASIATAYVGFQSSFNPGGLLHVEWDYEMITGSLGATPAPYPTDTQVPASQLGISLGSALGFQFMDGPNLSYRVRMHVTAPNEVYSDWYTVAPRISCSS